MSEVARLKVTIEADSKDAEKAIDKASNAAKDLAETMEKASSSAGKSMHDLGGTSKKALRGMEEAAEKHGNGIHDALQNAFSFSAGQLISDGLREAWNFMKQLASESISAASDLAEVQNVVDVTFGEGASQIDTWARSAKNAFGMGELKAKQFSGTMGAMLKSMGFAGDEVMDMSTNLVQLAGDMASFYNLEHEEAFEKIRAGISGETEPLKQLGINMSVANLEAYAMAQGIDKAYESMTQAEQAALRYNYLISATADAAGDFNRTSDSYASQVRTLSENLTEIKTMFGNALIDIVTPQLQELNQLLNSWLQENPLEEIARADREEEAKINLDYGTAVGIIEEMGAMEKAMGNAVYETDEWQASIKALSQTMPELGKYIDLNTGKIKVSTGELLEYAQAIRDVKLLAAAEQTLSSYNSVVDSRYQDLIDNQTKLIIARNRHAALTNPAQELMEMLGDNVGNDSMSTVFLNINDGLLSMYAKDQEMYDKIINSEAYKTLFGLNDNGESNANLAIQYMQEEEELERQQEEMTAAYQESVDAAAEAKEAVDEMVNSNTEAADASEELSNALSAQQTAMNGISDAAIKLKEHYNSLKEAARGSLQSVAGSLSSDIEIQTVNLANIITAMDKKNAEFSRYNNNILAAQQMGMDANMLAYLTSNASAENRAILDAWVNGGDAERAEFNKSFADYRMSEEKTATQMANAQAAVDETYQALEKELNDMVGAFNKADDVASNIDLTNVEIDEGMQAMIDTVRAGVVSINTLLSSLPGSFLLDFNIGGSPSGSKNGSKGFKPAQHNAKGLGYVPYDDYLTRLHKGETVLNRVEAENWRKGATTQSAGIDYDRLAAVLASQMAGMSMQMDGKMIGALIAPTVSRSIEREAWRGRY